MPTWDKVIQTFDTLQTDYLAKAVKELNRHTKRTTICYFSAFQTIKLPVPSPFHSIVDADMQGFMTCCKGVDKKGLDLILHTPGGSMEATKEIIGYLKGIFPHIRVFIPVKAMSGGTMIACACDEIWMGPYSHLGPTDPQVLIQDRYVPVGAIIKEFEIAFKEVQENPASSLLWKERLKSIPIGVYQSVKNMQKNSIIDLETLLKDRMLNNVPDKEIKARDIADFLNNPDKHTSHGRGINIELAKEKGLKVNNLHSDKRLEDFVLTIYHICSRLFETSNIQKIIMNHKDAKFMMHFNR